MTADLVINVLLAAMMLALIPAVIAAFRGGNFWAWWAFGVALFIVALPMAMLRTRTPTEGQLSCPACMTVVPAAALVCRACRTPLPSLVAVA